MISNAECDAYLFASHGLSSFVNLSGSRVEGAGGFVDLYQIKRN